MNTDQGQSRRATEHSHHYHPSLNVGRPAEQLIDRAYAELQAALSSMIINASGMKYPDPLLSIQIQHANQALSRLVRPSIRFGKPDRTALPRRKGRGNSRVRAHTSTRCAGISSRRGVLPTRSASDLNTIRPLDASKDTPSAANSVCMHGTPDVPREGVCRCLRA